MLFIDTRTGVYLIVVVPSPSCPLLLDPHEIKVLSVVSKKQKVSPQTIWEGVLPCTNDIVEKFK
jgi:hypothetical protein